MPTTTSWRVEESLAFDALCLLNTLTGDPFYLRYYQSAYDRLHPLLNGQEAAAVDEFHHILKREGQHIISALLCLYVSAYFPTVPTLSADGSAAKPQSLQDLSAALDDPERMLGALRATPYYNPDTWLLYDRSRPALRTVLRSLERIDFAAYWERELATGLRERCRTLRAELADDDFAGAIETALGIPLESHEITVHVLAYTQPHGIKLVGSRFLTDQVWPKQVVLRNAIHEMMHPPYRRDGSPLLARAIEAWKSDPFLWQRFQSRNPDFGYNTFEGLIEEDCVQALDQLLGERFGCALDPRTRWQQNDDGLHVFAVCVYCALHAESFDGQREPFAAFLVRMAQTRLQPGALRATYERFYAQPDEPAPS
jgi:hypothetical protein